MRTLWHGAQASRIRPASPKPTWNLPTGPVAASISIPSSQRVSTCTGRVLRLVSWRRCSKRRGGTVSPQLLGTPPPADRESVRHSTTMVDKAGKRMRTIEQKSAEMAAKVEQAWKAVASAEQDPDTNEKALAEERSHFHKTQQEHFCSFPFWFPSGKRRLRRAGRGACSSSKQQGRQW